MKMTTLVTCMFMLVAMAASTVEAAQPLLLGGNGSVRVGNGATIGYQFTIGATNLQVTALGIWDGANDGSGSGADGLLVAHDVGLWSSGGTLIGSVTVPSGTAAFLDGEFRYVSLLAPVQLTTGQIYSLGAYFPAGTPEPWRNNDASAAPTLNSHLDAGAGDPSGYNVGGALANLSVIDFGTPYVGPNLQFEVVPESTSVILLGLGGLLLWRRRTKK